jgi:hypothetical protein
MFGNMRTLWKEARASRLKEEYLDASGRMNSFTEEDSEHFFKTLDYAFRYWPKVIGNFSLQRCLRSCRF